MRIELQEVIDAVNARWSTWKMSKEWSMSQTAVRYTLRKYGLKTSPAPRVSFRIRKKRVMRPLSDFLVDGPASSRGHIKRRLLREGYLKNNCYICGINTWLEKPLVLRLDHINGKNDDYRLENLRLLCPNCDSQTSTYCGRNVAKKLRRVHLCECGQERYERSKKCNSCENVRRRNEAAQRRLAKLQPS